MISGYEFWKGPWHDVEWLLSEVDTYFREEVEPKGLGDRFTVTAARIMEHRRWAASRALIEANMDSILRELNIFYVPKTMDPGPALVFPLQDVYGRYKSGKIRPFYELVFKAGPAKYSFLGKKENVVGPSLFGMSDATLVNMGKTRSAILVEGYFDTLACRLLVPSAPVVSTGTKTVSEEHVHYLRMLGVQNIYLMFDNEAAKEGKEEGAGNQAMRILSAVLGRSTGLNIQALGCPNEDASMCLENYRSAFLLKQILLKKAAP